MSDILNAATAHYSTKLNSPKKVVLVPEWGTDGQPLKIYVKPSTLHIRDKIYKAVTKDGGLEALVDIIILRSLDSLDIPMFNQKDKATFMDSIDPDVIVRVATEINDDLSVSATEQLADLEKN